jgi:hypothetical protein
MTRSLRSVSRPRTALVLLLLQPCLAVAAKAPPVPPTPEQFKAAALGAVNGLVEAYNAKKKHAFMKLVSDNFAGDSAKLEDDVAQDFKLYSTVDLKLDQEPPVVSSMTVLVPFHYELTAATPDGGSHKFSGDSSFELDWVEGRVGLKRIGAPVFGQTSAADVEAAARASIAKLADAYTNKKRNAFMRLVADDFRGNSSTFEDALLADFRNYRTVNLQILVDDVEVDKTLAEVDFHYNMSLVDAAGEEQQYSGTSQFTFKWEGGVAMLYKMEAPLIFGNSLPASENPIAQSQAPVVAAAGKAPGAANPAVRGSVTLGPNPNVAFKFKTQTLTTTSGANDIYSAGTTIGAQSAIQDIGACNISTLGSVPKPSGTSATAVAGHCYAVLTTEGLYAAIAVNSISFSPPANTIISLTYVFQPGGTSSF